MPSKSTSTNKKLIITKLEEIVTRHNWKNGVSIPELIKPTGWRAHSIRGFMPGALKERGLVVVGTKQEGKYRRYMLKETA
jgi:hypothetical protein